jgi:hypothetical protein
MLSRSLPTPQRSDAVHWPQLLCATATRLLFVLVTLSASDVAAAPGPSFPINAEADLLVVKPSCVHRLPVRPSRPSGINQHRPVIVPRNAAFSRLQHTTGPHSR